MKESEEKKKIVREKYAEIAKQSKTQNETSCCGATSCCSSPDYTIFSENYTKLDGYNEDADLGLGCGLPTEFAQINEGDTVLDLGSGAGNDCFIARAIVGDSGTVIGLDMTQDMINLAEKNTEKHGFKNVEFRLGEIEDMPVNDNSIDVVVSNCVLNLVPNKEKALSETYRVLKPKGHFSISDVVLIGDLPEGLANDAEMYAGCVSGAIQKDDYIKLINDTGFKNVKIQKEKDVFLPDEILEKYISKDKIQEFRNSGTGIFSITVYAEKKKECDCNGDCDCGCNSNTVKEKSGCGCNCGC